MIQRKYKTIEVKLGNYTKRFEMRPTYVGCFVIDHRLFTIIGSDHALDMLSERGIDKYNIMSSLVGLGSKLSEYNNNNKHIIISNEDKNCSTVFTIENYTIVLITVLDKGQMHTSRTASTKETINLGSVG
jgi:hypothetical protein